MTLWECSREDLWVIIGLAFFSLMVCVQYSRVAWHNYKKARKYPNSNTKKYLLYKVWVFVFCALTGYGYTILAITVQPYKLKLIFLGLVAVLTELFIRYMKRTNVVDRIYKAEESLKEKYEKALKFEEIVSRNFKQDVGEVISYETLKGLVEGKWYDGPKGIRFRGIDLESDILHFKTTIEAGSYFSIHAHDCYEKCHIIKGELYRNRKGRVFSKYAYYEPLEFHSPGAEEYTELDVYFSKEPFKK